MVVLVPDSEKGRRWADRALVCIGREAEAVGVSINEEKTRLVSLTDPHACFAFLGFEFRWVQSPKSGWWFPCMTPKPKKVTEVLHKIRERLRASRHLPVRQAVAQVNPIVRGWVNYVRVGNASQALRKIRYHVERKVRRFVARQSKRAGFGWKRWSSETVYQPWGLFGDYRVGTSAAKARAGRKDP